jgi:S1-C subfamily serine protease
MKSKYGTHDIEDLVKFGVDPYVQRDIALYRKDLTDSLGLSLKKGAGNKRGCFIKAVKDETPAAMNGSLQAEDRIIRVNGNDVFNSDPANVSTLIKSQKEDPIVLDVTRGGSGSLSRGDGGYSSHAACPYYVSQMLSKDAEIVFAPYN